MFTLAFERRLRFFRLQYFALQFEMNVMLTMLSLFTRHLLIVEISLEIQRRFQVFIDLLDLRENHLKINIINPLNLFGFMCHLQQKTQVR